jgi:hypothetical protein
VTYLESKGDRQEDQRKYFMLGSSLQVQIKEAKIVRFLCRLIPAHCIFERDVKLLGRTFFHIPALCKLNPFYTQLMELRFRALCFLADECGEDISQYCQ